MRKATGKDQDGVEERDGVEGQAEGMKMSNLAGNVEPQTLIRKVGRVTILEFISKEVA